MSKNIFFLRCLNFAIIKRSEFVRFEKNIIPLNNDITRFITPYYGYNPFVLKYIEKNNIRNYKLAEQLCFISDRGFDINVEKEIDLNDVLFKIDVYRHKDLLLSVTINNDDSEINCFRDIFNGNLIMSEKKERYIVEYISNDLALYGIDLSEYDYHISETGKNQYEINLENIKTGKIIMIKNILLNKENNIYSVGINNGFIL